VSEASPQESESPQVVAGLLTEQEAAEIVDRLGEAGIRAHLWGTNLATAYGEGFSRNVCQVAVRQADVECAVALLAEFKRESSDIDWDAIDVGEPE
jgi:hypothetical protein